MIFMKRFLRLLSLALVLCVAVAAMCFPAGAADYSTKLETIRALGIMTGDGSGSLNLSASVTRAELSKMMTAASAYKDSIGDATGSALFQDVKSDHWASAYIKLAVEQGWMSGYVDGTFRPGNAVTLEEACSALLKLLGYGADSLSGSYPTAQLSKARAVGLLDDLSVSQGETLTRQDCVTLFYNLLTAQSSEEAVYGTTLGYTITNGEVDYASLVAADTKGPYVAQSGSLELPFPENGTTVYCNGALSALSAVERYDVYYYNTNLQTVWIYRNRVTGTVTQISPSQAAPTSVTVAGASYEIGTSAAAYKLSSQGSYSTGDIVTLLLGMNGEVVDVMSPQDHSTTYYGVVVSSEKSGSSAETSNGSASVQTVTQVACTDGVLRTFYHSGANLSAGRLVQVIYEDGCTAVTGLSARTLSGLVSDDGDSFAGYALADHVQILDTDGNGGYARIYPPRIEGSRLQADHVRYYTLNSENEIDQLILYEATGDTLTYAYLTAADGSSSGMNSSGNYEYILNGEVGSIGGSTVYRVSVGGIAMEYSAGQVESVRQLQCVDLDGLSVLTAQREDGVTYTLDEGVQVLLRDGKHYYASSLSEIRSDEYVLTGWYDDLGYPAGGRLRIIVAQES